MPSLTAKEKVERGRELAPLRQKAFQALDQNPDLTAKQISEMLGVNLNTATTWRTRWRKQKAKQKQRQAPEPVTTEITPESVADALLKRVVDALTEREELLAALKVYKSRVSELEKEVEIEKQEKDRILKIHNEQVQRRSLTDSDTLRRLAKL